MTLKDQLSGVLKGQGYTDKDVARGDIWTVQDSIVDFPASRLPGGRRTRHDTRFVLVIQCNEDNRAALYPTVLISPMSSQTDLKGRQDVELVKGSGGLPRDSVALLGQVQPILKRELKTKWGSLSGEELKAVLNTLLCNLGVLERPVREADSDEEEIPF